MLEASAGGYPDWAAPRYLQAEALALLAEHDRLNGGDPTENLDGRKDAIAAGRAINPTDATGLSRSSLAYLVDARWRAERGDDPSPAVAEGLAAMDEADRGQPQPRLGQPAQRRAAAGAGVVDDQAGATGGERSR